MRLRRLLPKRRRWTLSTQMAAVLGLSMLVLAVCVIIATEFYDAYMSARIAEGLPEPAKRVTSAIEKKQVPRPEDLAAVVQMDLASINANAALESTAALLVFTLIAVVVASAFGAFMARRLGQGLRDVAGAARRVAGGDLSARAAAIGGASIEEAQLTRDFNAMAAALQRADRELKDSTAAIAHELRTPLTVLSGRLHGIEDGVFDAGSGQIGSLIAQVDNLTRLVEDLRTVSLANSGQLTLNLAAIDLSDEVERVIEAMHPDLRAAGLAVVLDLDAAPMIGDPQRLRQALGAVLANAQRYAANSGDLRIETRSPRDAVIVRVLDRGPGVSAEASARAFERFWRGEQSRARHSGGSGLGLSVVRAIAEAHGGTVSLTARDGGGAVFEMILPHAPELLHAIVTNG